MLLDPWYPLKSSDLYLLQIRDTRKSIWWSLFLDMYVYVHRWNFVLAQKPLMIIWQPSEKTVSTQVLCNFAMLECTRRWTYSQRTSWCGQIMLPSVSDSLLIPASRRRCITTTFSTKVQTLLVTASQKWWKLGNFYPRTLSLARKGGFFWSTIAWESSESTWFVLWAKRVHNAVYNTSTCTVDEMFDGRICQKWVTDYGQLSLSRLPKFVCIGSNSLHVVCFLPFSYAPKRMHR